MVDLEREALLEAGFTPDDYYYDGADRSMHGKLDGGGGVVDLEREALLEAGFTPDDYDGADSGMYGKLDGGGVW